MSSGGCRSHNAAGFADCSLLNRTPMERSLITGEGPELWVAVAIGKIAAEFFSGKVDVAMSAPRSATELARIIDEGNFLPGVEFVPVLKADQLQKYLKMIGTNESHMSEFKP